MRSGRAVSRRPGQLRRPLRRAMLKGYNSAVYKAASRHGRFNSAVALKVYDVSQMVPFLKHQAFRELDVHRRVNHRHVVQLYAAFVDNGFLVLVLEYARGGDLRRVMRKLGAEAMMNERTAATLVLLPLMEALAALHCVGVVHRDLKPENVLFSEDWQLKLADFGVAIDMEAEAPVTRTGTARYMAPEVARCPLKSAPEDNKECASLAYTPAADIWSLGVLAYELFAGVPPDPAVLAQAVAEANSRRGTDSGAALLRERLIFPRHVSTASASLVLRMLQPQPMDRPTILELLADPYVHALSRGFPTRTHSHMSHMPQCP